MNQNVLAVIDVPSTGTFMSSSGAMEECSEEEPANLPPGAGGSGGGRMQPYAHPGLVSSLAALWLDSDLQCSIFHASHAVQNATDMQASLPVLPKRRR